MHLPNIHSLFGDDDIENDQLGVVGDSEGFVEVDHDGIFLIGLDKPMVFVLPETVVGIEFGTKQDPDSKILW